MSRKILSGTLVDEVAVQGVCAWPNLQRTAQGDLLAFIFNQPCHARWEGDLDCYRSTDQGQTWHFHSRVAAHEPGCNRMNCAAGLAANGDVLVICSGWQNRGKPGSTDVPKWKKPMPTFVYRSVDGGQHWETIETFPLPDNGGKSYIPFGNIRIADDGALAVSCYYMVNNQHSSYLLRSTDQGQSWGQAVVLNPVGNETDILHLGQGRWLASSREEATRDVELLRSEDDGRSWHAQGKVTHPEQHTSHLLRLRDGRVLLSYGNRCQNNTGVDARISEDDGKTWGAPFRLAHTPSSDCGYPATVQVDDKHMVTLYYTQLPGWYKYDMRVCRWELA